MALCIVFPRHIKRASKEIEANLWNKKALLGFELTDKKLGLVGFGSIGKEIARIAKGYSMQVHCIVANYSPSRAVALHEDGIILVESLEKINGPQ